jgi:hypothetical protein
MHALDSADARDLKFRRAVRLSTRRRSTRAARTTRGRSVGRSRRVRAIESVDDDEGDDDDDDDDDDDARRGVGVESPFLRVAAPTTNYLLYVLDTRYEGVSMNE